MALTLNIIGAGHVGSALGRVFARSAGFVVRDVLTRSIASAEQAVRFIGAGRPVARILDMGPAQAYMLAVSDDQIAPVCAALAASRSLAGVLVFHCSGAKASGELRAAAEDGALVASVHPIRSFADPAKVAQEFAGTFCGVEGDGAALLALAPALAMAGARPVAIEANAKTIYHAASVFASNYLVTVLDAALRAYQTAGVPEEVARALAGPLVMETVENVLRLGAVEALSGPIARGDHATVAQQQAALDGWDAPTGRLYQALAEATLGVARRKNRP